MKEDQLTEDVIVTSNRDDHITTISDDNTGVYNNVKVQNDENNTIEIRRGEVGNSNRPRRRGTITKSARVRKPHSKPLDQEES